MPRAGARSSTNPCCQSRTLPRRAACRPSYSVLDVAPSSVTVESVKKAEDTNEYIVRLYETEGKPANAVLNFTRTPHGPRMKPT
jgi:alpha-mannosidase